jgi:hypothetical protein
LGKSASHIWRSVVDGKDMLKQGLIKRIGTWECTHIWNFDWLLRDGLLRSVACFLHDPPNMWSGLYDLVTVSWDLEKLKDVFLPVNVEAILNTPRLQGRSLMGVALRPKRHCFLRAQHIVCLCKPRISAQHVLRAV